MSEIVKKIKLKAEGEERIDFIYDHIDNKMRLNQWNSLEKDFKDFIDHFDEFELDDLISIIVSSLPGRLKINLRYDLLQKCKEKYNEKNLWQGLD